MQVFPLTNLFLIGPMGAGKTTVGNHLAKTFNLPFYDVDAAIEQRSKMSINTIFDLEQEIGFRQREAALIEELTQLNGLVLATGGGCVTLSQNRENLLSRGIVIYLQVYLTTQWKRLQPELCNRPLLAGDNPFDKLEQLNNERNFWYQSLAHLTYDTEQFTDPQLLAHQIYTDIIHKELWNK